MEFEDKYKEIYDLREKILSGAIDIPQALIDEYDARAKELDDEDYKKIEVTPADVKDIQNTLKGVSGFWLKAMLNH